jgi:hypothetical protein
MRASKRGSGVAGLLAMALVSCNTPPPIVPLTDRDCREGAAVVGSAPPGGDLQRCELPGGVRHGKSRAWFENGRLRYETEWWQGKKHGTFTLWYASGQKRAAGQDRHGVPDGTWLYWAEDGQIVQERVFRASDPSSVSDRRTP